MKKQQEEEEEVEDSPERGWREKAGRPEGRRN